MEDFSTEYQVDSDFAVDGSVFPNEFVNPEIKKRDSYGLKYAKAMYHSSGRFGLNNTHWNNTDYDALMEIAQGRQSVESIRKMFGFFNDPSSADDDGSASLSFLDIQVLNLAPKYINRAVEKIINRKYDVQLAAIDPVSVHDKATYEANLRTYYELREWFSNMSMSPRDFFPDLDVDVLPEYPDEVMYELLTNPKIRKAIDGELSLTLLQEINNFNQKMRMYAWDIVVFGRGHLECYRDENGIPRVKKINPKYYIGSYVEDENFQEQEYAGYLDFPTVNQFRKEASATMGDDEIQKIVQQYAFQNDNSRAIDPGRQYENYDGLNYIPVMRFYFLSQDDRLYITRRNQFGNITMMERGLSWKGKEGDNFEGIIKNSYTTVYGGTWVLDSNSVYNYGPKSYTRSNLVDVTLPIVTFSPNYKDGRTVSFAAQMIEPLNMINTAWNKIKEIMAKGWMGFQEIDFTQLEAVSLNKGGKNWSARQVYQHFLQTGRLVKRSAVNKYDQRYSSSAVEGNAGGLMLSDYFTTFTTGINMLEQMTATTVAESVDQPDRLAVRVMQQSQQTGDLDMGYLFNAYEYGYRDISKQMLLAMQSAKQDGIGISGFVQSLGKHISVPEHIAYSDYGLFLVQGPSDMEWAEFYQELQIGLQNGTVTHLDSAYIREVRNLKKARQVLAIRMKINERKAAQMKQQDIQANMEANKMSAQEKTKGELATIQAKSKAKMQEIELQGMIDERLKKLELQGQSAIAQRAGEVKQNVSKQASVDEIIKQSVRNKGELEKTKAKPVPSPAKK
jgi:hypothetical protein